MKKGMQPLSFLFVFQICTNLIFVHDNLVFMKILIWTSQKLQKDKQLRNKLIIGIASKLFAIQFFFLTSHCHI